MNRITGPFLFLIAFAIGISFPALRSSLLNNDAAMVDTGTPPVSPIASSAIKSEDDFEPEFRDLPGFNDESAYVAPSTKLVDVFEYGNEYFRSEAIAKNGETWLGLFEKNGEYELRNTKVKVQLAFKAKDPDYEDSVRLNFDINSRPLFITKGSKSLTPGQVHAIYNRPSPEEVASRNLPLKQLSQGYIEQFDQLGKGYKLRVAPGTTNDGRKVNVLVLETKDLQQILTYNVYHKDHNTVYNSIGDLLWVGDLDGDNKLDLYLSDFGYEKGGFSSKLFLSSEAEPGNLVKLAADFGTSGC